MYFICIKTSWDRLRNQANSRRKQTVRNIKMVTVFESKVEIESKILGFMCQF